MNIKGKKTIEYLLTRTNDHRIIRVYQMDNEEYNIGKFSTNALTLPILVDYKGFGEDLTTILEERDQFKKRVEELEYKRNDEEFEKREKLTNRVCDLEEKLLKKYWWKFWR